MGLEFVLKSFKHKTVLLTRDKCSGCNRFLRQESEAEELCTAVKQNSKHPFETTWFLGLIQLLTVPFFTFSPLSSVLILFPIRNVPDLASLKWCVCVS